MTKYSSSLNWFIFCVSKDWALNFCIANFCYVLAMWWLQWEKSNKSNMYKAITESNSKRSLLILTKMPELQLQSVSLCANPSVQPIGSCKDCYKYYCI